MTSDPSQRQDLDSILDAALDELADSDSDDIDVAPTGRPSSTAVNRQTDNDAPPCYGPPVPPSTNLTQEEAELAASLEGMMRQFMNFNGCDFNEDHLSGLENAERAMEDVIHKLMNEGLQDSQCENKAANDAAKSVKSHNNNNHTNQTDKDNNNKKKNKQSKPVKMDQTINTLLNNIQQPESIPPTDNNTMDPTSFTDSSIQNLLNDISQMTSSSDANPLIDTVMKQLLNKELMYQPMKEVCDRFPSWLARHKDSLSDEEYERYGKQYQYFQRICRVYEVEPENFERLMELMQDIQE
jgi:peroxin-19